MGYLDQLVRESKQERSEGAVYKAGRSRKQLKQKAKKQIITATPQQESTFQKMKRFVKGEASKTFDEGKKYLSYKLSPSRAIRSHFLEKQKIDKARMIAKTRSKIAAVKKEAKSNIGISRVFEQTEKERLEKRKNKFGY